MEKIGVVISKEWLELKEQRMLLVSILILPVMLSIIPLVSLFGIGLSPASSGTDDFTRELLKANPAFAGLSEQAATQALLGQSFSSLMLLLPMLLPSILAAYSIVGEKTGRTLEPLLAAPITIWELLLGKIFATLIPSVVLSWLASVIFMIGVSSSAVDPRVISLVISSGWLLLLIFCAPLLSLIAIAAMVMISSRTSDPRTAQQYSSILVVPFLALFFSQMFGILVLSPSIALGAILLIAAFAGLMLWGAVVLFQRDTILTRWN